MAINIGKPNIGLDQILSEVSEIDILDHYFNINSIPCVISSPLRPDGHPSFGLYSRDGQKIHWVDFATKESGDTFDLLGKYWRESYNNVLTHIWEDLPNITKTNGCTRPNRPKVNITHEYGSNIDLQCKVREWKNYDIEYWKSYGISIKWLKYADIYPISYKIVVKGEHRMVFQADKYSYAYVEYKEGKATLKIYQPFNTKGFKWSNRHDKSVISLWTKVPEFGEQICICSSMKDALCLWANTGIPAIALQGEGYGMSETACKELKRRFKKVFILLDNDEVGLIDAEKLAISTGFTKVVLPQFDGGKDISDLYYVIKDKDKFKKIILSLFN